MNEELTRAIAVWPYGFMLRTETEASLKLYNKIITTGFTILDVNVFSDVNATILCSYFLTTSRLYIDSLPERTKTTFVHEFLRTYETYILNQRVDLFLGTDKPLKKRRFDEDEEEGLIYSETLLSKFMQKLILLESPEKIESLKQEILEAARSKKWHSVVIKDVDIEKLEKAFGAAITVAKENICLLFSTDKYFQQTMLPLVVDIKCAEYPDIKDRVLPVLFETWHNLPDLASKMFPTIYYICDLGAQSVKSSASSTMYRGL